MNEEDYLVKGPVWSGARYERRGSKHVMIEDVSREMKLMKIKNALNINEEEATKLLDKMNSEEELTFSKKQLHQLMVFGLRFNCEDKEEWRNRRLQQEEEMKTNRLKQEETLKKAEVWFETLSKEEQEMVMAYGYEHCKIVAVG